MSLLEQNIIRKEQIDKNISELNFNVSNSKEYQIEVIHDGVIYASRIENYLQGFYYLVTWKNYPKKKNI